MQFVASLWPLFLVGFVVAGIAALYFLVNAGRKAFAGFTAKAEHGVKLGSDFTGQPGFTPGEDFEGQKQGIVGAGQNFGAAFIANAASALFGVLLALSVVFNVVLAIQH